MTRHSADRLPVAIILSLTALDILVYCTIDNAWLLGGYFLLMILPKSCICAWSHHHQHTKTFRSTALNRILELSYAFHTGITTNLWLLHHVFGHHHLYLDQARDQSRWRRKNGSKMGELEYTLSIVATAHLRALKVGLKHPRHLGDHLLYTALAVAIVTTLLALDPLAGLFVFALPMLTGLFMTAWVTYDHHAGLETQNHFEASFNNENRLMNLLTGNLGYHTAHHYKQGMHWSELPKLHANIRSEIPEQLFLRDTFWDRVCALPLLRRMAA